MIKAAILSFAAFGALTAAVPAAAVIQNFANYSQLNGLKTVRWTNGTSNSLTAGNGVGGRIFTTKTGANTGTAGLMPGSTKVQFSFLEPPLFGLTSPIFNTPAIFTLFGKTTLAATVNGNVVTQSGIDGTFSFIAPMALNHNCNAPCTNLLSATFTNGALVGQKGSRNLSLQLGSSMSQTLVYTSDFLDFNLTVLRSASFTTSDLSNVVSVLAGKSLRASRGSYGGVFSSDPTPVVNGVPEPEVWGLMVVGFGMVGLQVRRRARQSAIAA